MIVVDSNLLAYLLLPTAHAARAEAVYRKDPEWIAPALVQSELRNVLLGAIRRKDLSEEDGLSLLERAEELITTPEEGPNGREVLALALGSGCSAYDCEFVWLARALRRPLVTCDKQVLSAFPTAALSPEAFLGA